MKKQIRLSFLVLLLTVCCFCFAVRAEEKVTSPSPMASDEMTVYVIRESSFVGVTRRVWVACNENVLASIGSGDYCSFKVKSGPNIISIVQAKAPGMACLAGYKPGETVYLSLNYAKGSLTRVDTEIGLKLLEKNKNESVLEAPRPNEVYDFFLINPGICGIEFMKKTDQFLKPDPEHAVITFIRPDQFIKQVPFGLWNGDQFLGSLKGDSYFQVKVKPGKHCFIGRSERVSILEAEVEAGKSYTVQLKAKMGWMYAHIQLLPVKQETSADTLQKWMKESNLVALDQNSLTNDVKTVIGWTKPVIQDILKKVQNKELETRKLEIGDGR